MAQTLRHREKLQKQFNEVAKGMPNEEKLKLQEMMKRMPLLKQEQLLAELVAQFQRREGMSDQERQAEAMQEAQLSAAF